MKYWATKLKREEIIAILEDGKVEDNSLCLLHHSDGETFVSETTSFNNSVIEKSGKFYLKELSAVDWFNFQMEKKFTITGNIDLAPFKLVPSNPIR